MGLDIYHYNLEKECESSERFAFEMEDKDPTVAHETKQSIVELCRYAQKSPIVCASLVLEEYFNWQETFAAKNLKYDEWKWAALVQAGDSYNVQFNKASKFDRIWQKKPHWVRGNGWVKPHERTTRISDFQDRFGELIFMKNEIITRESPTVTVYCNQEPVGTERRGMKDEFYKMIPPNFFVVDKALALDIVSKFAIDIDSTKEKLKLDKWIDGISFLSIDW